MRKFLPLVLVLLVSGCVQVDSIISGITGPQKAPVDGIEIKEFSASPQEQYSGRRVRLSVTVENTGNYPSQALVCLIGENFRQGSSEKDYRYGFWLTSDELCKKTRTLNAFDPVQNIPGGTSIVKWTVTAPFVQPGMRVTDTFTARVFFRYRTSATASIPVVSEIERLAASERGESLPVFEYTQTKGPLKIEMKLSPETLIGFEDGASGNLVITVRNTGPGTVFSPDVKLKEEYPEIREDDLNKVRLEVSASEGVDLKCDYTGDLELFNNELTVSCDVSTKRVSTMAKFPVYVTVDYGYYVDAPVSVSVVSRPGAAPELPPEREEKPKPEFYSFNVEGGKIKKIDGSSFTEKDFLLTVRDTARFWYHAKEAASECLDKTGEKFFNCIYKNVPPMKTLVFYVTASGEDKLKMTDVPKVNGNYYKFDLYPDRMALDKPVSDGIVVLPYRKIDGGRSGTYIDNKAPVTLNSGTKFYLDVADPFFGGGGKKPVTISFEYELEKKIGENQRVVRSGTAELTLNFREKEYSQEFEIKPGERVTKKFAEGEELSIDRDSIDFEGSCTLSVKSVNNEPTVTVKCGGGLVDVNYYERPALKLETGKEAVVGYNILGVKGNLIDGLEYNSAEGEFYPCAVSKNEVDGININNIRQIPDSKKLTIKIKRLEDCGENCYRYRVWVELFPDLNEDIAESCLTSNR